MLSLLSLYRSSVFALYCSEYLSFLVVSVKSDKRLTTSTLHLSAKRTKKQRHVFFYFIFFYFMQLERAYKHNGMIANLQSHLTKPSHQLSISHSSRNFIFPCEYGHSRCRALRQKKKNGQPFDCNQQSKFQKSTVSSKSHPTKQHLLFPINIKLHANKVTNYFSKYSNKC